MQRLALTNRQYLKSNMIGMNVGYGDWICLKVKHDKSIHCMAGSMIIAH